MESQTENALIQWLESVDLFEITVAFGVIWIVLRSIFKTIPVIGKAIEGLSNLSSLDTMREDIEDITLAIFDYDEAGRKVSKIEKIENAHEKHNEVNNAILSKIGIVENEVKITQLRKDRDDTR